MRLVPLFAFSLTLVLQCWICQVAAAPPASALPDRSIKMELALERYVIPALQSARMAARIYYVGACNESNKRRLELPLVRAHAPSHSDIGVDAIEGIFEDDSSVRVAEGEDGIIRIVIGDVPTRILGTVISSIRFGRIEQYSEGLALWRIMASDEVKIAERELNFSFIAPALRMSMATEPAEGRPHLPASLNDLSYEQALDLLAQTLHSIVVYGVCADKPKYSIYVIWMRFQDQNGQSH